MKKMVAVSLAVPVIFGLSACGGNGSGGGSGATSGVSDRPTSAAPVANAGDKKDLPANFPLPPGAKVLASIKAQNQISVAILLSDPSNAVQFWTKELPAAGYSVDQTEPKSSHVVIHFSGNGYSNCTLAVGGNAAHVVMSQ